MKRLFLLLAVFAVQSSVALEVQVVNTANNKRVALGEKLSEKVLSRYFGKAERISKFYDDEVYEANVAHYDYRDISLETIDERLNCFGIDSPQYKVIIDKKYQVKIGDSYSLFLAMLPEGYYFIRTYDDGWIGIYWRVGPGPEDFCDSSLMLQVEEDTISCITWHEPI